MPEHTTETGFAPVHVTSEGLGAVGLCALMHGENRWVERRHSAQTAAGFAGSQQYLQGPSCSGPAWTNAWTNVSSACSGRERRTLRTQCRKARSNDVGDVGPHGDISVDVNIKVPNSSDRWHQNITDMNRGGRDQVLTSRWGAPEDLGLGEIQLQSICLHPRWILADADEYNIIAEQDRQSRMADNVHRSGCRLHTRVAWDDDVYRAATGRQSGQCTGETRSVQGPNLAGLQSRLPPMASNWTSLCELVVFGPWGTT